MMMKKYTQVCLNEHCQTHSSFYEKASPNCRTCIYNISKVKGIPRNIKNLLAIFAVLLVLIFLGSKLAYFFANKQENIVLAKPICTSAPVASEVIYEKQEEVPSVEPPKYDIALRLHGSNTIGAKLMPKLVEAFLKSKGYENIRYSTENDSEERCVIGNMPGKDTPIAVEIFSHGTSTAFSDLADATCDIGMASRKIKKEEQDKLEKLGYGNLSSRSSEYSIALDGIAVIINNTNPLVKLTKEQLRAIFKGDIADWSILGGSKGKINIYVRDDRSGTYDTFKNLILGSAGLSKDAKRFEDSEGLSDAVSKDIQGIGFIGLPYIGCAKPVAISDGNVSAVLPSTFNIATEDYPLTRRLYLYMPEKKTTLGKELIDFILSKEGQDIVKESDLVSQNIQIEEQKVFDNSLWESEVQKQKFRETLRDSQGRLSVSFRFKNASFDLDNKALKDIERVVQLLNRSTYLDYNVVLVGFTDNIGDYGKNLDLSILRANAVKNNLIALNKSLENRIKVVGLGQEKPVASNSTPEGKNKNRRVEIWMIP